MISIPRAGVYVWLSLCVNVAGMLTTCGLGLYSGQPWRKYHSLSDWAVEFLLHLWALMPYLILVIFLLRSHRAIGQQVVLLACSSLVVGFGIFEYSSAVLVISDAQAGLSFISVPLFQLIGVGLGLACARALRDESGRDRSLEGTE